MRIRLYNENPNPKHLLKIVDCLKNGGIIIYPTDTIYGIGCNIHCQRSIDSISQILEKKKDKSLYSFICYDLSHLSDYTKPINNTIFKAMKKALPGPYTFILNANNNVPRIFESKKKTVGIRVPDNNIVREIVRELGNPILSKSLSVEDESIEYITDPDLIYEKYGNLVDIFIDGGYGDYVGSTVLDCTTDKIEVIRKGKGQIDFF